MSGQVERATWRELAPGHWRGWLGNYAMEVDVYRAEDGHEGDSVGWLVEQVDGDNCAAGNIIEGGIVDEVLEHAEKTARGFLR